MALQVILQYDRFKIHSTYQQQAVKFLRVVRFGLRADDIAVDEVLDRLTEEAVSFSDCKSKADQPLLQYLSLTGSHKPAQPHAHCRGST